MAGKSAGCSSSDDVLSYNHTYYPYSFSDPPSGIICTCTLPSYQLAPASQSASQPISKVEWMARIVGRSGHIPALKSWCVCGGLWTIGINGWVMDGCVRCVTAIRNTECP